MESMIAASDRLGWPSVRGVQVTNNTWGYRLYSSLGFVPQEQLSLMAGLSRAGWHRTCSAGPPVPAGSRYSAWRH